MAESFASDDENYFDDDGELSDYVYGFQGVEDVDPLLSNGRCSAKVITKETLLAAQKEDLERVMDMFSIGQHHARTLLIHFRWDVDKIFELSADLGIDKLFALAGVKVAQCHQLPASASSSSLTCDVCIDDKPANEFTTMDCGHCFCNDCWTEHFIVKINEGQSRRIQCMTHKCNSVCDTAIVDSLVKARDPKLAAKFHQFLMESYVEDNNRVKCCPSAPHCGNAIRADKLCEVECSCGMQFCFSCSSEAHSPCSCLMWELWTKKCQDESANVTWLTVYTKICPKCRKFVEKNGGCNHVTCTCGQSFCWLCGGATGRDHSWTSIENHSCGRYKDSEKKVKDAKHELERYMHYYNRHKAHMDSCKLEAKLKEEIHMKVDALQTKKSMDYSWATNGVNRVFRSRWILSVSYPFAYYMFGNELFKSEMTPKVRKIKQDLFEDQQQQLEAHVENLSKCLEERFDEYDEDKFRKIRMQILNVSNVVDSLCKKMYECIENDLLGSLQHTSISIAPYHSEGVEKATPI